MLGVAGGRGLGGSINWKFKRENSEWMEPEGKGGDQKRPPSDGGPHFNKIE